MSTDIDRIERHIDIEASAERVWALVATPGWFINDGAIVEHVVERRGELEIVHDPVHGPFPVRAEKLDPPRYAAFRWLSRDAVDASTEDSTLVEFWIEDRAEGGVTLRVAESGFASLSVTEDERRTRLADNTEGWELELEAARTRLDPLAVERSIHVAVRPELLWPVLVEPAHLAAWYAFEGATIDLRPGGAMELRWAEHGLFRARVVAVEAPGRFAYEIAAEPDIEPGEHTSTLVTFTVRPSGTGSLLTVTHTGFADLDPRFGSATGLAATEADGWDGGLATLAGYLPGVPASSVPA